MSIQGIILIDILGVGLILLTLNLIRVQRLFVGYGLLMDIAVCALVLIVSVPPLRALVTKAVGALSLREHACVYFYIHCAYSVQCAAIHCLKPSG